MKRQLYLMLTLLVLALVGCTDDVAWQESRELVQIKTVDNMEGHISAAFILGCGGMHGDTEHPYKYIMYVKDSTGSVELLELYANNADQPHSNGNYDVFLHFVDSTTTPYLTHTARGECLKGYAPSKRIYPVSPTIRTRYDIYVPEDAVEYTYNVNLE